MRTDYCVPSKYVLVSEQVARELRNEDWNIRNIEIDLLLSV